MTAQFPTPLHLVTSDSEMTTSKRVTIQNPLIFFFRNTATDIKFFFQPYHLRKAPCWRWITTRASQEVSWPSLLPSLKPPAAPKGTNTTRMKTTLNTPRPITRHKNANFSLFVRVGAIREIFPSATRTSHLQTEQMKVVDSWALSSVLADYHRGETHKAQIRSTICGTAPIIAIPILPAGILIK